MPENAAQGALRTTAVLIVCMEQYDRQGNINSLSTLSTAQAFIEYFQKREVAALFACISVSADKQGVIDDLRRTFGNGLRNARAADIDAALKDLRAAKSADNLVVYWIGHGLSDPEDDQEDQRLVLPETDELSTHTIRVQKLRKHLTDPAFPFREQLIIIDACRGYLPDDHRNSLPPHPLLTPKAPKKVPQHLFHGVQNGLFADGKDGGLFSREVLGILRDLPSDATLPGLAGTLRTRLEERFLQLRAVDPRLKQFPVSVDYATEGGGRERILDMPSATPRSFAQHHIEALHALLSDISLPASLLSRLYWSSLPAKAPRRQDRSLQSILAHLSELPIPSAGVPPLLRFALELSARLPARREPLKNWAEALAETYGLPAEVIDQVPPKRRYFVTVVLGADEDADGRRHASIQVWKEDAEEPDRQHEWLSEAPVTLDEVRLNLSKQLDALDEDMQRGEAGADTEIMIEFCLPRLLLVEPVDRWKIKHPLGKERPIGADYPVIVRDIQRLNRQAARNNWAACWKRMGREPKPTADDIVWLADVYEEPEAVVRRLLPASDEEPEIVCIGFSYMLGAECLQKNEQNCLLGPWYAGLPVALWPRNQVTGQEEVQRLLKGYLISELPQRVFQLRQQAYEKPAQESNRFNADLTLVWDDPQRIRYAEHMRGRI